MTPKSLADLHGKAFSSTRAWSENEFAVLLTQKGVVCCGDTRCMVLIRTIVDEAEILTLATDPAYRRQGLAYDVLQQAEAECAKTGARQVFLEVAEDNIAALGLYGKAGYKQVGRRPGYYLPKDGAPVAAFVLRKAIMAG